MTGQEAKAAADSFQQLLHTHFPIAVAMKVIVDSYTGDEVVLRAPITPNRNVHQTGFAGSLYSLGALAGWGLAHGWLDRTHPDATLLIGRGEIKYLKPVRHEFTATSTVKDNRSRDAFLEAVSRDERAELDLEARISSDAEEAAIFNGRFIVLKRKGTHETGT